jgi:hypothetical protein
MLQNTVKLLKKKILVGRRRATLGRMKYPLRTWMLSTATGKFGLKIVNREELAKDSDKYHVLQFGSEEKLVINKPDRSFILDDFPRFTSKIGTYDLKQPFVSEVMNAELVGPAAVGFDREGNLISETVIPGQRAFEIGLPVRTFVLNKLPNFGLPQLGTVCSFANSFSLNYFHWVIDFLLQLEGLEYYQEETGRKPNLLINSHPTNWQKESLWLLGYEPNDCIEWQWNWSKVKAERLVVPSFRHEQGLVPPTACQWLRQRILSNLPELESQKLSFSSRIYISRRQNTGRYVINEEEVLAALKPLGFVAYTLENMSFSDQVRLFTQAEIVVAPHGAGLTNMVFAQNLSVVELFGSFVVAAYFLLAKALGFNYGFLTSGHSGKNQYREKFDGIVVDVAKLQSLVAEMLSIHSDRQPASTTY